MSAIAALQFLEGETPLEELLIEARSALASQYPDDLRLTDDMAALATEMLGALVKLEAPDPPAILRAYASTSFPVENVRAPLAISFACLIVTALMIRFISGVAIGEVLNSSRPRPSRMIVMIKSPAISPHIPTQMPALWP